MNIFEKLKNREPVDMMSEEYRPAVAELHRADRALFHLNHAEPRSEEWNQAFHELFIEDYDDWDFALTEEEMNQMTVLERDERFADY